MGSWRIQGPVRVGEAGWGPLAWGASHLGRGLMAGYQEPSVPRSHPHIPDVDCTAAPGPLGHGPSCAHRPPSSEQGGAGWDQAALPR